jgi:hypothetical protein
VASRGLPDLRLAKKGSKTALFCLFSKVRKTSSRLLIFACRIGIIEASDLTKEDEN